MVLWKFFVSVETWLIFLQTTTRSTQRHSFVAAHVSQHIHVLWSVGTDNYICLFSGGPPCEGDVLSVTLAMLAGGILGVIRDAKPLGCLGVWPLQAEARIMGSPADQAVALMTHLQRGSTARAVMQKSDTQCTIHLFLTCLVLRPFAPAIVVQRTLYATVEGRWGFWKRVRMSFLVHGCLVFSCVWRWLSRGCTLLTTMSTALTACNGQ